MRLQYYLILLVQYFSSLEFLRDGLALRWLSETRTSFMLSKCEEPAAVVGYEGVQRFGPATLALV